MDINDHRLAELLRHAAQVAAVSTLIRTGHLKPYITKAEAFRLFGRKNVEKWLVTGYLTPRKDGGHSAAWRIDRMEIEICSRAILISDLLNQ